MYSLITYCAFFLCRSLNTACCCYFFFITFYTYGIFYCSNSCQGLNKINNSVLFSNAPVISVCITTQALTYSFFKKQRWLKEVTAGSTLSFRGIYIRMGWLETWNKPWIAGCKCTRPRRYADAMKLVREAAPESTRWLVNMAAVERARAIIKGKNTKRWIRLRICRFSFYLLLYVKSGLIVGSSGGDCTT